MKTLTLLRHAKSSWKRPDLGDFERPLNGRGRTDAPNMGRRLARRGLQPTRIVSSPALRARATAEAVADALAYPHARILWEPRIYEAGVQTLLTILRGQADEDAHLLIVGHNPGLTMLANALTGDRLDNLPTAGAYTLTLPIEQWRATDWGIGTRTLLMVPKDPAEAETATSPVTG
ncbi:SixA phosphatase family protein [Acidihalobacter prosperus]|uniref:Phosphohistidine phosphatase SixA n=1 Tax=Acidihalobacter prosperus TaxID=160660 RepID=A0A1A6C788_9GAMM|nr:histidine phosphatase family protein [Acidihalobacter prosperus]OBS10414.1 Phosphohistidine phosphatase SixA [Acidihalobacter prosperus]